MKPPKIIAIVVLLGVISRPFAVEPSHAQDNGYSLPLEVWGYVEYANWSLDSTQFTFTVLDYSNDPLTWYTYVAETGLILTSSLYPIPVQLSAINKVNLQIPEYAFEESSISPSGQYMAYPSTNYDEYHSSLLGITSLETGKFVILDVHLFGDLRYEWSADEQAVVVETIIPYGVAYNAYHIQHISPELNEVTSSYVQQPDIPRYHFFDLNADNTLAMGYSQDEQYMDQIFVWSLDDLTHYALIPAPTGLIDAQFSVARPDTILAVIGNDLVEYDISGDPIEISRHPLGISDIVEAYFSPDQSHVALVSKSDHDGYQIINVVKLPNDHQP